MKAKYLGICLVLVLAICGLSQAATKVLEWKFENNLDDTSGNGLNGDPCGTPVYSPGMSGQAFDSDGSIAVLKTGISTALLPVLAADTWSVNIWVYTDTVPLDWRLAWCMGVQPSGSYSYGRARCVYSPAAGTIVHTDADPNGGASTGIPWDVGQWQMITTTFDGTKIRVYKNGILIGAKDQITLQDTLGQVMVPSKYDSTSYTTFFAGKFDEFTIWRGALTQQQIIDLIPPGIVPEVELVEEVVYYNMDDPCSSPQIMPDHSGNAYTGVLYHAPISIAGKKDKALVFPIDSTSNQQAITLPVSVSQNAQFSVAFWLRAGWESYQSAFYAEDATTSGDGSEFMFRGDEDLGGGLVKVYGKNKSSTMQYYIVFNAKGYLTRLEWHHWAFTMDGNEATLYVDGEVVDSNRVVSTTSKSDMANNSFVGYNPVGGKWLGIWSEAYMDEFHAYRGALSQEQVQSLASMSNMDNDTDVDFGDVDILADEWLDDYTVTPPTTYVVDDMEGGSIAGWIVHHSTQYSGTGTISLTTNAHSGSGALRWDYNLPATPTNGNYTSIYYDLGSAVDFSSYDQMKLYLYRHTGNGPENLLFLKFYKYGTGNIGDGNNIKAEAWIQNNNCVTTPANQWDLWQINLDFLRGPGGSGVRDSSALTDIRYIMIGCGSWDKKNARTGRIDIDDVEILRAAVCSIPLSADINYDCKVNFKDFAILADDWMLGAD